MSEKKAAQDGCSEGYLLLPPNLACLVRLAATGRHPRYALSGVHLVATAGGYRAEASTGTVLGIVEGAQNGAGQFPVLPVLEAAAGGAAEVLVPAAAWQEAFQMVPKKVIKPVLCDWLAEQGDARLIEQAVRLLGEPWPDEQALLGWLSRRRPAKSHYLWGAVQQFAARRAQELQLHPREVPLEELLVCTPAQLSAGKCGFGPVVLKELQQALVQQGLHLAGVSTVVEGQS